MLCRTGDPQAGKKPVMSLGLTLFVEHGREQEAVDFYAAAFGGRVEASHDHKGHVIAVDLVIDGTPVSVAGANPKRQQSPSLGGPFHPKAAGAVSAIVQLQVADLGAAVHAALSAGATVRDPIQPDQTGRRVASVFDPFGHIWALLERQAAAQPRAA